MALDTVCLLGGGLKQLLKRRWHHEEARDLCFLLRLSETAIFVELGFIHSLTPKHVVPCRETKQGIP